MKKTIVAVFVAVLLMPFVAKADADIDPLTWNFGDVRVGSSSTPKTYTLTSNWLVPTKIVSTDLHNTQSFSIPTADDNCTGVTLQPSSPGNTCTFDVIFTPQDMKQYITHVGYGTSAFISYGDPVYGRGVAPEVRLTPTSINFGDQTVGKSTNAYGIFLDNIGTGTLTISNTTADAPFSVSSTTCGTTVAAHDGCVIGVVFTPTATGPASGNMTLTDDASDSPQTVALTGTGVTAPQPHASLSRTAIDFSYVLVGTTSAAEEVTLQNTGTLVLNIASIAITGDYAVTDDCGATLAVNATCTLSMTFSPTAAGAATGTVTITDDSSHSPQTIALTGTGTIHDGPKANLSASTIDFGNVTVDTSSDAQSYTIENMGDENMVVSDIEITGTDATSFTKESDCLRTLAPGQSCTGEITFHPVTQKSYSAAVQFTDNTSDSPQTIALTGLGIYATVSGGSCSLTAGSHATALIGFMPIVLALAGLLVRRRKD